MINSKVIIAMTLLSLFMIFFPLSEYIFLNDIVARKLDLFLFICSQITALSLSFYLAHNLKIINFNSVESNNLDLRIKYPLQKMLFIVSCCFFIIFMSFLFSSGTTLSNLAVFSESYRNGGYKGSGIYTAGMTQFVPFFIAIMLVKEKKLGLYFYLTMMMMMVVSYSLGLRIYLLVVCFFLVIRVASGDKKVQAFIIIALLILFLVSFKFFLNEDIRTQSLGEITMHILGRTAYRFIIYDSNFGVTFNIEYVLPLLNKFYSCDSECFKYEFVSQIPEIIQYMPFISKYSGVAVPLPVLIFNIFGFFGFILVVPFVILLFFCLKRSYCSSSSLVSILSILVTYYMFAILCEDITYFLKFETAFIVVLCTYLIIRLSKLRFK